MDEHSQAVKHPQRGYEDSEVSLGRLFAFAAGVAGLVVFGVVASAVVFHFFVRHQPLGPPASPFEDVRQLPPEPRLQTEAPEDLDQYRAEQEKVFKTYGWVDSEGGVVRIPVDRAMDILLAKGFPLRGNSRGAPNPAKPASPKGRARE